MARNCSTGSEKADAPEKLEDTLLGLEKKSWEALKKDDHREAADQLADDFLAVIDGQRMTRKELLDMLADYRVKDYTLTEFKLARQSADAAVISYRVKVSFTYKGEAGEDTAWATTAWAKRNGKWVSVLYHESKGGG